MVGTLGRRFPPDVPKLAGRAWEGDGDKVVQRILEELTDAIQGLPMRHASTHLGGDDDLAGTTDPITVALSNVADPGKATLGFAPINHVHELDATGIIGADTMDLNGQTNLVVFDATNYKLLEDVLLQLKILLYGNDLSASGRPNS